MNDIRTKVGNENDKVEAYLAIEDHDSLGIYVDINDSMYIENTKRRRIWVNRSLHVVFKSSLISIIYNLSHHTVAYGCCARSKSKKKIGTK